MGNQLVYFVSPNSKIHLSNHHHDLFPIDADQEISLLEPRSLRIGEHSDLTQLDALNLVTITIVMMKTVIIVMMMMAMVVTLVTLMMMKEVMIVNLDTLNNLSQFQICLNEYVK